jgi:hypothetical protein
MIVLVCGPVHVFPTPVKRLALPLITSQLRYRGIRKRSSRVPFCPLFALPSFLAHFLSLYHLLLFFFAHTLAYFHKVKKGKVTPVRDRVGP